MAAKSLYDWVREKDLLPVREPHGIIIANKTKNMKKRDSSRSKYSRLTAHQRKRLAPTQFPVPNLSLNPSSPES